MNRKPYGYWNNKERCIKEALKYKTRTELYKGTRGVHEAARLNGWMDDICGHMEELLKPNGYWSNNKDNCAKEALKYETRTAFQKGSPSACSAAQNNGWMDDICDHMEELKKPNGYWTFAKCLEQAQQYTTISVFKTTSPSAYQAANREGWLDKICSHMISPIKYHGYWNKEHCSEEAEKYGTRGEFQKGCAYAYAKARLNGWLDDICSHMRIVGSTEMRAIYALMFKSTKCVYVGLSYDPLGDRLNSHLVSSSNENLAYQLSVEDCEIIVFDGWHAKDKAGAAEQEIIDHYEAGGWEILNLVKTGALGGSTIKWNKENLHKEALKYNTRSAFRTGSPSAYATTLRHVWMDDNCEHMTPITKPNGYWNNKENCHNVAKKYSTRGAFRWAPGGAYAGSLRNGWMDEFFPK